MSVYLSRPGLTSSLLGQLGHRIDVGLVDEGRAGQSRPAATDDVLVVQVQPQRVDGQVALQVRLLVDGPLNAAVLDGGDQCSVGVEGADLGLAARVADG